MSVQSNAPVIIKRKKVVAAEGHHGGAWKIAYADFVTAMMAFFLLMWLLNATTEKQRKGLADYFNPTIPVNRISGGGDGVFGGDSVFTEETLAQNGTGGSSKEDGQGRDRETAALRSLESELLGQGGESSATDMLLRHIVTRVTDEGLVVDLFAAEGEPLFAPDTATPQPILHQLVRLVAEIFALSTNPIAVSGHVASRPVVLVENPNWDLSTTRAQAARELMELAGTPGERMTRVSGWSDRKARVEPPISVGNNRVELILLRTKF